jgi:uncharacterized repeat protein (TIGR03803 family)
MSDMGAKRLGPLGEFRRAAASLAIAAAAAILPAGGAAAFTEQVLHTFTAGDGRNVEATLARDQAGNLYGTTRLGGLSDDGTVFEMVRQHNGSWKFKRLYNFCARAACTDGQFPDSDRLILDTAGRLYGTTARGGAGNQGVAYMLTPNETRSRWTLQVLHHFCTRDSNCPDGAQPSSGLTYQGVEDGVPFDGVSPLFGVTSRGGWPDKGIAYTLINPRGDWIEQDIHVFCTLGNCADGSQPKGDLTMDIAGNLYGAASAGANGGGTIFKLSPPASGHLWNPSVLYTFCQLANCADGSGPNGALVFDGSGNAFGTTLEGGAHASGTIFELAAGGAETVLRSFCAKTNCIDGSTPHAGLVIDGAGRLFGTTYFGGAANAGTAFRWTSTFFSVLYSFCSQPSCADGSGASGGLLREGTGSLFGTTISGGTVSPQEGTVYELVP